MEFVIILNNPAYPGNVGSVARAMKTMGLENLYLVESCDIHHQDARNMAYQSHDILDRALFFDHLKEAVSDLDLIIGTTAKERALKDEFIDVRSLRRFIEDKASMIRKVGIVFGNEENGLSNEDLNLCDVVSTIPLATNYPSLNLAQSVMIYTYELAQLKLSSENVEKPERGELKELKKKSGKLFKEINLTRNPKLHQRIKDRIMLANSGDSKLMLTVLKYLDRKLKGKPL